MGTAINKIGYKVSPFQHAQIFLSYSWNDKPFAINLYRQLSRYFWVWFDSRKNIRDRTFQIGESVVPEETILHSDFFLCIASDSYFDTNGSAYKEWEIASKSWLNDEKRIGIVTFDDYRVVKNIHQGRLYVRINNSRIEELINQLKSRLLQLSGIVSEKRLYIGGRRTDDVIRSIININLTKKPRVGSLLPISVGMPQIETELVIHRVKQLSELDRNSFTSKLIDIVSWAGNSNDVVARMNAAYILSRLWEDRHKDSNIASYRVLGDSCPFEYRSSRVAASYLGNLDPIFEYAEKLSRVKKTDPKMEHLLKQNIGYHIFYYGSVEAALTAVRNGIRETVKNILPINVITLGYISTSTRDIELIESKENLILSFGITKSMLTATINRIHNNMKR